MKRSPGRKTRSGYVAFMRHGRPARLRSCAASPLPWPPVGAAAGKGRPRRSRHRPRRGRRRFLPQLPLASDPQHLASAPLVRCDTVWEGYGETEDILSHYSTHYTARAAVKDGCKDGPAPWARRVIALVRDPGSGKCSAVGGKCHGHALVFFCPSRSAFTEGAERTRTGIRTARRLTYGWITKMNGEGNQREGGEDGPGWAGSVSRSE